MRKYLACFLGLLLFSATAAGPSVFAEPPQAPDKNKPSAIRVEAVYVMVNVTVTNPNGRVVTGLEKENFRVFEGTVEQEILHFSNEDAPISIGIILDISGSMSNKKEKVLLALQSFLKTCNHKDEFFLVSFGDRAERKTGFTSDIAVIQDAMKDLQVKGRTALLDAVYLGLGYMQSNARKWQPGAAINSNPLPEKRVLLIISDGGDNHSRYNERDIKNFVKESDVQIYAIGIYDPPGYRSRTPEELSGPSLLTELTEMTGGKVFTIEIKNTGLRFGDAIKDTAEKIGLELRNQYVIMYNPSDKKHDGKWRKVKVIVSPRTGESHLDVRAKTGYYAPQH